MKMVKKYIIGLILLFMFLMPTLGFAQTPKRFSLHFPNAEFLYETGSNSIQLIGFDSLLCNSEDWEVKKLKPFLFHIKQKFWKEFFWKVNTSRKRIWRVTQGTFGRLGGKDQLLNASVGSFVGSPENPARFAVVLSNGYLAHSPSAGSPQIVFEGNVLSYGRDWEIKQLKPYLYHLRQESWRNSFWKVNTSRKKVFRVTNGSFGALGGNDYDLNMKVEVVESTDRAPPVSGTTSDSRIYGRILSSTGRGISGLTVQAVDKDMLYDDLLGFATTDRRGNFEIRYTYTNEEIADKRPDIYLKVIDARGRLIHKTDIRFEAKMLEQFIVRISLR